jgi:hypothetical protein
MKDTIYQNMKAETGVESKVAVDLINGYYLSFLAIGVLTIILKIDISADLKQGLFFILLWLIFGSVDLFKSASRKESNTDKNIKIPQTIIQGNYYDGVGGRIYNTSNQQVKDKLDIPSNYFDVLKTIEIVPESSDPNKASIRDLLVELQSYVESDYSLSLIEKEAILEVLKSIAIEANQHPNNKDLEYVAESIKGIDRNLDFKSRVISALKSGAMAAVDYYTPKSVQILIAFIDGWKETARINIKNP